MERLMLLNVLKDVGTKPCNDSYQNVTNAVSSSVETLLKIKCSNCIVLAVQGRKSPSS